MTTKSKKLNPIEEIERFMAFMEAYNCQIVYKRDGKDADAEDGVLDGFREILHQRNDRPKKR